MKAFLLLILAWNVLALTRKTMESGISYVPSSWKRIQPSPKQERITLTLAVKQQNLAELEKTLYRVSYPNSPDYGKHLSMIEVNKLVAPSSECVNTVKSWMVEHGLTDIKESSNSDFLIATTNIETVERMLETSYYAYQHNSEEKDLLTPLLSSGSRRLSRRPSQRPLIVHRVSNGYSVPINVSKCLDFVSPTVRFPVVRTTKIKTTKPTDLFVTPSTLHGLAQVPNGTVSQAPNNLQSFASFLEQYYSDSDLQEFFTLFSTASVGQTVTAIGPNDPTNPGTEAELDVQYIMGVGTKVPTWAYYTAGRAPNPANEPFLDWITNVSMSSTIPFVFSVSYGEDEKSVGIDYASRVNVEFQKVGVRGSSIMFASGDSGAGGNCSDSGRYTPDFPSGSPYVTAVGGVTGGTPGATPTGEEVDFISGGGFSDYWPTPSWQADAVKTYLATATGLPSPSVYNQTGRGYPDVAAQSEMFIVVQDGIPLPGVGGTSCASPSFSGIISLLNDLRLQQGKSSLGFLNPLIYQTAPVVTNSFNDVKSGYNEGCSIVGFPAAPGWDPTSGWGSPNYSLLKNVVLSLP